jgi:hypothetical protein
MPAFFGSASNPADNGAYATSPVVITPPADMQAGDLVFVTVCFSGTSGTLTVSEAGGQDWHNLTTRNQTRNRTRSFWCEFNGTWSANPSWTGSGTSNVIARMIVWRPDGGTTSHWVVANAESSGNYSAPAGPDYIVMMNGVTPPDLYTVVIAGWTSADDNTWGVLTSSPAWNALNPAQVRNTSGSYDQSQTHAWIINNGATGNVSQNQLTLGGDAGTYIIVSFREIAIHSYSGEIGMDVLPESSYSSEKLPEVFPYTGRRAAELTPESAYEKYFASVFPYTGWRAAELTPASSYEFPYGTYTYTGNIQIDLTPSSSFHGNEPVEHVYIGRRATGILPESAYVLNSFSIFTYSGRRAVSLMPDFPKPSIEKEYAGSISHGWIPDLVGLETIFVYTGGLGFSLLPNFPNAGLIYPPYIATLGLSLLPASGKGLLEKTYTGAITIVLTPSVSTGVQEKIYSGQISLTLRPIGQYLGTVEYRYLGNIPLYLFPVVVQTVREAIYNGSIPLALIPSSQYGQAGPNVHTYDGKLDLGLLPASTYGLLSLGAYSYDGWLPLILDPSVGTGVLAWTGIPYVPPAPPIKKRPRHRGRLAGEKLKVYGDFQMGDD